MAEQEKSMETQDQDLQETQPTQEISLEQKTVDLLENLCRWQAEIVDRLERIESKDYPKPRSDVSINNADAIAKFIKFPEIKFPVEELKNIDKTLNKQAPSLKRVQVLGSSKSTDVDGYTDHYSDGSSKTYRFQRDLKGVIVGIDVEEKHGSSR